MFDRDLVAELPFTLMHPKPEEEEPNIITERSPRNSVDQQSLTSPPDSTTNAIQQVPTGNLIQLDG